MATGLGVSPDSVDGMTVARVRELLEYWRDYPPVHLLVRGAVGYKSSPPDDTPPPAGPI